MHPSLKVCGALMARLSNDVHCASMLAVSGYPAQVVSLVASAFETAHCIVAIGDDDPAAEHWIEHEDPTTPFMSIRELLRRSLTGSGVPANVLEAEYRVYRQLCMVKHANPLIQRQLGIEVEGAVTVFNGPDCSEESIRAIWFGLEHAARLASFAAVRFARVHLPGVHLDLVKRIEAVASHRKQLERRAKSRWGTADPCPGRW
jgi:hypothetical protein